MTDDERLKRYRFPKEIIRHVVWLTHRFMLSLKDVSEIMLARGIEVSYESIRVWGIKFGPLIDKELKRRAPRRGDKWHLDEVCLVINKKKHWLSRAVDQNGYELDILLQRHRNQKAAKRFFKHPLKGLQYVPRVIITDKLKSSGAAKRTLLPWVKHRQHKGINNRAENSHQSTRQQENQMWKFKSPKQAQRFLFLHGQVRNCFYAGRYKYSASAVRQALRNAFYCWNEIALQNQCV
ncbi:MAG: IS6 family transposase [Gammaproteobacteria bacterium]